MELLSDVVTELVYELVFQMAAGLVLEMMQLLKVKDTNIPL